ncbi:MAG: serine/threonine protein kinase, partial [Candidatus Adiutrix sp.]|nr:serine/threonine protein kinase [Candidatus Adiutrix sp.]
VINLGDAWFRVSISNLPNAEKVSFRRGTHCPGCGQALPKSALTTLCSPDVLCDGCRANPVAALKLLKAGLSRRISALSPLKGLRIDGLLGRGATSAVFLVTRRESAVQLALKVMPPAVSSNLWARKSFLREAALGRALRHRNVVRMYEAGSYSGAYVVLMEYCSGGSSEEERTANGGRLSVERALSIILPVLDGLDFLHHARLASSGPDGPMGKSTVGMIHRDVKPANIFLGGEDGLIPKIADIGVAKYHSQGGSCNTRTGTVAGSPATMPRQQAMNFKYAGPEVDVWATAASLFKLITGEYPRRFSSKRDPWQVVLNEKPRPLKSLMPDAPPHLAEVLDKALEDDPAIYYQTAASLKKDLLKAIEQDDIML